MNAGLHPHWQSTDGDSSPQKTSIPVVQEDTSAHTELSRKPAAIVGMLLVLGIMSLFFQGVTDLRAQVASGVSVRITEQGLIPASLSIRAGEDIVWINEKDVPQIILSDTLCSASGSCLKTITLFGGEQDRTTVPLDAPSGLHRILSETDVNIEGDITVVGGSIGSISNTQNPLAPPVFQNIPSPQENPLSDMLPEETNHTPVPSEIFAPERRPINQPKTGMDTWMVFGISTLSLYWLTRTWKPRAY